MGRSTGLVCLTRAREMRILSLISERALIQRILRHLGFGEHGGRVRPTRNPPTPETVIEPWLGDPFLDYDTDPVMANANG